MAARVLVENLSKRRRVERRVTVLRPLERALALDLDDFEVGNCGLELRIPIDEALVLVDQPVAVELDKDLGDSPRQAFVHREALAAPVARGAETLELADDGAARFDLPRPDPLQELVAAEIAPARLLALHQLALDDHLRRNAGVIGARLPQDVLAPHAPIAAENVLQRVIERMAHMQRAGHVRRRNDDAEWLSLGAFRPAGAEGARRLPLRPDAALDDAGVERLLHHEEIQWFPAAARSPCLQGTEGVA